MRLAPPPELIAQHAKARREVARACRDGVAFALWAVPRVLSLSRRVAVIRLRWLAVAMSALRLHGSEEERLEGSSMPPCCRRGYGRGPHNAGTLYPLAVVVVTAYRRVHHLMESCERLGGWVCAKGKAAVLHAADRLAAQEFWICFEPEDVAILADRMAPKRHVLVGKITQHAHPLMRHEALNCDGVPKDVIPPVRVDGV